MPRFYGKTDPEVLAMFQAAGLEAVRNETGGTLDKEGMKALLTDCNGVIVGVGPINIEVIATTPKFKAIAKYGMGVDNIDLDATRTRDIKVSRVVGANVEVVTDYAMALFLVVTRKTVLIGQHCRQDDQKKITTRDVTGGTIGILGLGAIGRNMTRRAQGFDMRVPAHDPLWDGVCAKARGIIHAAPDKVSAECGVISLHLSLTPETENFIGAAEPAGMKPDAILINTAQGSLIDENALLDTSEVGRLCDAGIDAFPSEPLKDPRWFTPGNVVPGSHCAAPTVGASHDTGRMATANLIHDLGLQGERTAVKYTLAHGLGTSGNKATLFSGEGKMATSEVLRYDCHYFSTNWVEQDPEDFRKVICITNHNLIDKARIDSGDIAVISSSGQMMGCLCVDR